MKRCRHQILECLPRIHNPIHKCEAILGCIHRTEAKPIGDKLQITQIVENVANFSKIFSC